VNDRLPYRIRSTSSARLFDEIVLREDMLETGQPALAVIRGAREVFTSRRVSRPNDRPPRPYARPIGISQTGEQFAGRDVNLECGANGVQPTTSQRDPISSAAP